VLRHVMRSLVAEFVGTAFLLAGIVGSGIMAQRLVGDNVGLALLANAVATGGVLVAVILAFGPVSGAHFNPLVTLGFAVRGDLPWGRVPAYIVAQSAGAFAGAGAANSMFGLPVFFASHHARSGVPLLLGEFIATFGLIGIIIACARFRPTAVAYAVGAYIVGAYWFTSSTSFANPVVTLARAATDTFAGIAPQDVLGFVLAQIVGGACATALLVWLIPATRSERKDMVTQA
jgi:glycerol uptake facilitator-like aquaporin